MVKEVGLGSDHGAGVTVSVEAVDVEVVSVLIRRSLLASSFFGRSCWHGGRCRRWIGNGLKWVETRVGALECVRRCCRARKRFEKVVTRVEGRSRVRTSRGS